MPIDHNVFPKALSTKKADDWLATHPGVDPIAFWLDQSAKNLKSSRRWLTAALVLIGVGIALQIIAAVARLAA